MIEKYLKLFDSCGIKHDDEYVYNLTKDQLKLLGVENIIDYWWLSSKMKIIDDDGNVLCYDCIQCKDCFLCTKCTCCNDCDRCYECFDCNNCTDCYKAQRLNNGHHAYKVIIMSENIQGCRKQE